MPLPPAPVDEQVLHAYLWRVSNVEDRPLLRGSLFPEVTTFCKRWKVSTEEDDKAEGTWCLEGVTNCPLLTEGGTTDLTVAETVGSQGFRAWLWVYLSLVWGIWFSFLSLQLQLHKALRMGILSIVGWDGVWYMSQVAQGKCEPVCSVSILSLVYSKL